MGSYIKIILLLLVGKGWKSPFLMSREIFSHEVASPQKDRARKAEKMNKTEKMRGCVALCSVSLNNLKELREQLLYELKALYKALEIEDQDSEKIEDPELYKIALDYDYNAESLETCAEELESIIKDLERIKL